MQDTWSLFDYGHEAVKLAGAAVLAWITWIQRTTNQHGEDIKILQAHHETDVERLDDHGARLKAIEKTQTEILAKLSGLPTRSDLKDGFLEINRRVDSVILAVRDVILSRRAPPRSLCTDPDDAVG